MMTAIGVHELFERHAAAQPRQLALVRGDFSMDYEELNSTANRIAHRLIAQGLAPDQPVGLMFARGPEFIVGALAVLKAGGAYLPLDSSYPEDRLRAMLETARPACVLTTDADSGLLPAGTSTLLYDQVSVGRDEPTHNPALAGHPDMLACMFFTSGSTGTPKGVMVPHRAVMRLVDDQAPGQYTRFGPDEVLLMHSALSFDAVTYEIWGALAHGGSVVIGPSNVPSLGELAKILRRHRVTQTFLTTGLFHLLVDERPRALGVLSRVLAGGDVMSSKRVRQLFDELPQTTLVHVYGPTECTTFALANVVDSADGVDGDSVPIGRPIPRTTARILDERLRSVPDGEPGELYLGGDGLARGYLGEPTLTACRFVPDPYGHDGARLYATGDRARIVGDGQIDFLGRADHQVKIRGVRIELAEVEEHLRQHPEVMDVVALPIGDSAEERRLAAFLILGAESAQRPVNPEDEEQRIAGIREWLAQRLPSQMVPGIWQVMQAFPLNSNAKIDRPQLVRLADSTDNGKIGG